jgi:hypothetical protein
MPVFTADAAINAVKNTSSFFTGGSYGTENRKQYTVQCVVYRLL